MYRLSVILGFAPALNEPLRNNELIHVVEHVECTANFEREKSLFIGGGSGIKGGINLSVSKLRYTAHKRSTSC